MLIKDFTHHLDDYECMWNGIEDIYMNRTGEKLPDQFFFAMSGFCSFAYLKTNKSDLKRMVAFGEGRTKQMYQFLAPIVSFSYQFLECKRPELALAKAKKEIDQGYPVMIGALDMYHLDYYPKLFHKVHVPFHYVLMVGYDEEEAAIFLYDCGRKEILKLSYENLMAAMNAEYPGLCKPNTLCRIRMDEPKNPKYILKTAMEYKADLFINPPTGFLGINGMKKMAKELPGWEKELGKEETDKILRNMVQFFGSVPTIPNRLNGVAKKDEVVFQCSRDKMCRVLTESGMQYQNTNLVDGGRLFGESGKLFEKLSDVLVDYILNTKSNLKSAGEMLLEIADLEYQAYQAVKNGIREL